METGTKGRRSDATRNRARILEIAEECFAEHGLEVPLDTIAKQAGVGAGTLYRHFPNRETLIAALVADRIGDLQQIHHDLVAAELTAGTRLERWLEAIRTWMTSYDGLPDPLREAWEKDATMLGAHCRPVVDMTDQLLRDAQQHGDARPDLSGRDLYLANLGAAWAASAPLADSQSGACIVDILGSGWRATTP